MLPAQTANLPPEQRQRLHADFLANEQAYLQMRERLLPHYRGQWVAVHEGKVVAAGANLLTITEASAATGGHPYLALVGAEEAVVFRVRRAAFAYDQAYQPFQKLRRQRQIDVFREPLDDAEHLRQRCAALEDQAASQFGTEQQTTTAFTCRAGCKERDVSKYRNAGPVKCNVMVWRRPR